MKRLFRTAFLVVLGMTALSASEAAAQTQKFGFVNTAQLLAQAPGTAEARQSLETEMQGYRTELDRLPGVGPVLAARNSIRSRRSCGPSGATAATSLRRTCGPTPARWTSR